MAGAPQAGSDPGVHSSQAGAKAFAPMREFWRAVLAAQDRVSRTRGLRAELLRADPADARREAGLLEDRLREIGPRAIAPRGHVVGAVRQPHDLPRRLGEMADVGRGAALVVDDRDLIALRSEPEHRPQEVVRGRAEEPRGAHDPRLGA